MSGYITSQEGDFGASRWFLAVVGSTNGHNKHNKFKRPIVKITAGKPKSALDCRVSFHHLSNVSAINLR